MQITNPLLSLGLTLAIALAGCDCGGDPLGEYVPDVRPDPGALAFGAVTLGSTETQTVTLTNVGTAPAVLPEGGIVLDAPANGGWHVDEVAARVPANGSIQLDVTFAPRAEGPLDAVLRVSFNPPQAPIEITLAAAGAPADVSITPGTIDFGTLPAGESATRAVTLENRTDASLRVPLVLETSGFLVEGGRRYEVELDAGASVDVDVTFAPVRGGPYESLLLAELCGPDCGPRVALQGGGEAPRIVASPRPISLGDVSTGDTASETLVLENAGVGTLTLYAISAVDADGRVEVEPPALPVSLAAGETTEVGVTFTAGTPDAEVSASVLVDSSDPLSPRVSVPIEATTAGSALRVLPEAGHLGVLDPGQQGNIDVVAVSRGTDPVTVIDIELAGSSSFALVTGLPSLPLELLPGDSVILPVRGTATQTDATFGSASATLTFTTAEVGEATSSLTFASGTAGCQPRAPVSGLYLGGMRLGQGAQGRMYIQNDGDAPCTLESIEPVPGLSFDPGFSYELDGIGSLLPGDRGGIRFAFFAATAGTYSAWLEVKFVEQEAPLLVNATASGVVGGLVAEPPNVTFGPTIETCPGSPRGVNFVNDGGAPVTIVSLEIVPSDAAFTLGDATLPLLLAAGGAKTVTLIPDTSSVGVFTGQVVATTEELGEVPANLESIVEPLGTPLTETFTIEDEPTNKVDILFVVDNSGSMADDQATLAENFATFIESANNATDIDFHMGVTSTDVLDGTNALNGRLLGPPHVLTPATPNLQTTFESYAVLGTNGAGIELGLEAMRLALSEPLRSTDNAGFLRANAALSVIVVSDEDDAGDEPSLATYYPAGVPSLQGYMAFLEAVKNGTLTNAPVLFSAVTQIGRAARYERMVEEFGGLLVDIDDPAWGEDLAELGERTFALQRTFRLSNPPDPATLVVEVDEVEQVVDVDFVIQGELGDTIVLNEQPPAGSVIEISYLADCSAGMTP